MNIVLTGATGFLGSHLLKVLVDDGHFVTIIKRSTSNCDRISSIVSNCHFVDVDKQPLESAFSHCPIDAIIHTACCYGRKGESASEIMETNVIFPLKLVECSINHNVKVFINSDTLLPSNINPYSISKRQFVSWLQYYSRNLTIINLKMEHMYGSGDDCNKFLGWVLCELEKNVPYIELTEGKQLRDFIYVDDIVSAFLSVLKVSQELENYSEYEVGTGHSTQVSEVISMLYSLFREQNPSCRTKLKFGAIPLRKGELMDIHVDNSALLNLGWRPQVSFEQGLKKIIRGKRVGI